jgi:hypothetical protein
MTQGQRTPRQYPRYEVARRVSVKVSRPEKSVALWGLIADLSEGGMAATSVGDLRPTMLSYYDFQLEPMFPNWKYVSWFDIKYGAGIRILWP